MRMENKVWIWIQVSDTCALGMGVPRLGVGSALSQAAFWETGLLTLSSTPLPHNLHKNDFPVTYLWAAGSNEPAHCPGNMKAPMVSIEKGSGF